MRTNIVIDDDLMDQVMRETDVTTKKEAVERGLRLLLQQAQQNSLREIRGKYQWDGNLNDMRTDK